jgi:hypothetical protein
MSSIYIYLARLDKKGIKVLSGFEYGKKVYPTRVRDITSLNLNPEILSKISKEAHENRMEYELYIESATSFNELRENLQKRGYSNLPLQQFAGYVPPTSINEKALVTKSSTMFQRKSNVKQ